VYGGYWAPDGYFWYQTRIGGAYIRDYDRHFRRDNHKGYKKYRYQDRRDHDGRDRDHDRNTYPPLFKGQDRDGRNGDWRGDNNRSGNGGSWNGGGQPSGNPAPGKGGGWNGRDNDDRGGDKGSPRWNGNGGNGAPPLFSGQKPPRVNPAPPSGDGGGRQTGRADRGNWKSSEGNGGGKGNGANGRGDRGDRGAQWGQQNGGGSPPPLAAPSPSQHKSPSLWSKSKNDGERGGGKGGGNRGGGDGERGKGKGGKYGKRPD
jgi:hypothetical protein